MNYLSYCIVGVLAAVSVFAGELSPLRVEGRKLVADGREVRLRGVNWGWWHEKGTRYTEDDMRQQAAWGANVVRLPFSYRDITDAEGNWNEERVRAIDEVIAWASKYRQYVILDMHEVPGGQTPIHYCAAGRNAVWSEKESQERFAALWRKLAMRYRNHPAVGAYELMNEPRTTPYDPKKVADLQRYVIGKIREVDPDKVIVVTGDEMSNYGVSLIDVIKQQDPAVLYTIHFYPGAFSRWSHNVGEKGGVSGTRDWFFFQLPVEIPNEEGMELSVMLRSSNNQGIAWFDDLSFTDEQGNVQRTFDFTQGYVPFAIERYPFGELRHDPEVGHEKAGSLRIEGTNSYNSWSGPRWKVQPGKKYMISGWIKLEHATGDTYLGAAFYKPWRPDLDELHRLLIPAKNFSDKYNVPVLVGEFSIIRDSGPEGYQAAAIADRIRAMERAGFHWTYWNFHETTGPGTMALQAQKKDGSGDYPVNEMLLEVLKKGWEGTLAQ